MKNILIVDDEIEICQTLETLLTLEGYKVQSITNPIDILQTIESFNPSCVLLDMIMPGEDGLSVLKRIKKYDRSLPVIMLTACDEVKNAVLVMKQGATNYLTKPFDVNELTAILDKAVKQYLSSAHSNHLTHRVGRFESLESILGISPSMKSVIEGVRMIANTSANVLILGESGTGKEVLASIIHQRSSRKLGPYVPIDCASLPSNLIESLLFGHEQGAFTDAQKTQIGKLEIAHQGTIFLDEIGNIPLSIQAKLLRFIETREVERIGAKKPIPVSVRLIAATNLDLKEAVKKGAFRADLYHRLNEFPITIPPLRERRDDIVAFSERLLNLVCSEIDIEPIKFSPEALDALLQYEYPGNIRELKNMLKRAAILAQGDIKPEHLNLKRDSNTPLLMQHRFDVLVPQNAPLKDISRQALQTLEDQLIRRALEKTEWHYGKAALLLGITPRTLYNKMKELQIDIGPTS